jgi:hypothetical protein
MLEIMSFENGTKVKVYFGLPMGDLGTRDSYEAVVVEKAFDYACSREYVIRYKDFLGRVVEDTRPEKDLEPISDKVR